MSYSRAKKLCTKVKSSGDCYRVPGSGRKLLIKVTILLLKVPNQHPNQTTAT